MRWFVALFVCLIPCVVGCSKDQKSKNNPEETIDPMTPITEAEVKQALIEFLTSDKSYHKTKLETLEFLTPLIPVSETFYEKNTWYYRTAVACYVKCECVPQPGEQSAKQYRQLIIAARDNGKGIPTRRGTLEICTRVDANGKTDPFMWAMGEEWLKSNPPPKEWINSTPGTTEPKGK